MAGCKLSYTFEEDNQILDLIVQTDGFYCLTSKCFWNDLENSVFQQVLAKFDRTFLKNYTSKYYGPKLHNCTDRETKNTSCLPSTDYRN